MQRAAPIAMLHGVVHTHDHTHTYIKTVVGAQRTRMLGVHPGHAALSVHARQHGHHVGVRLRKAGCIALCALAQRLDAFGAPHRRCCRRLRIQSVALAWSVVGIDFQHREYAAAVGEDQVAGALPAAQLRPGSQCKRARRQQLATKSIAATTCRQGARLIEWRSIRGTSSGRPGCACCRDAQPGRKQNISKCCAVLLCNRDVPSSSHCGCSKALPQRTW